MGIVMLDFRTNRLARAEYSAHVRLDDGVEYAGLTTAVVRNKSPKVHDYRQYEAIVMRWRVGGIRRNGFRLDGKVPDVRHWRLL